MLHNISCDKFVKTYLNKQIVIKTKRNIER